MKLALTVSTHAAQFEAVAFKGDLEATFAKLKAWGYDGVELAIRDPKLVDQESLKASLARHGLTVPAIGTGQAWGEEGLSFTSPDPAIRQAAIERVRSHVPLAAELGAVIVIGLLRGIPTAEQQPDEVMGFLVEALATCAASAAESGVRLALEPINRYETGLINSARQGLALITAVGAPNVGLLLDTFHMNIEEPSIEESIALCGDRIFHFHVADSNRWHPGAGHLDFASILQTLFATGYDGAVSGEFLPLPDGDSSAKEAHSYLMQISGVPT